MTYNKTKQINTILQDNVDINNMVPDTEVHDIDTEIKILNMYGFHIVKESLK